MMQQTLNNKIWRKALRFIVCAILIFLCNATFAFQSFSITLFFTAITWLICSRFFLKNKFDLILMLAPIVTYNSIMFYKFFIIDKQVIYLPFLALMLVPLITIFFYWVLLSFQSKLNRSLGIFSFVMTVIVISFLIIPSLAFNKMVTCESGRKESLKFIDSLSKIEVLTTQDLKSNSFYGKKILIDFWYVECPSCIKQLNYLDKLAQKLGSDSSVQIIAIANGSIDSKEKINDFLFQKKYHFKVLYDSAGNFTKGQSVSEYPQQMVFDSKLNLVHHRIGFNNDISLVYVDKMYNVIKLSQ